MDNETRLDPLQTWASVLGELQLQMTRATFDTWLKQTHAVAYEDGLFVVATHSAYAKDWLENQLLTLVKRTLTRIVGRAVEIKFVVRSRPAAEIAPRLLLAPNDNGKLDNVVQDPGSSNERYTFGNFVVGPSNRMAHAAAIAVAGHPAESYNPLFLFGGVGLGKTHLLHAINHSTRKNRQRTVFVSAEEFTNDLMNAIRTHTTDDFRNKYRIADVLLIDDIQFIGGKESTQEEFFHTFNALHTSNRQIVISGDRPPHSFTTLEQRLCSRLEGGLIAKIEPPDFETRLAILRKRAERQPSAVPEEIIEYLASKIRSNIRELEGSLTRVIAYANLLNCELTVATAQTALQDVIAQPAPPSLDVILNSVANFYVISDEELVGPRRNKKIALSRQIAMYLMREESGATLSQIGRALGGRDHSTVLHGCQKIAIMEKRDEKIRHDLLAIRELLYQRVPIMGTAFSPVVQKAQY